MMRKKIGFGIVGAGMIAGIHAQAIESVEDAYLAGVYDLIPENAARFAADRRCKAYASYQDMLSDPAVCAVSVCTPSGLHFDNAFRAIQAGRHILIEKPMCLNLKDADELIGAGKAAGVLISVVSQLRFSPDIAKLKKALEDGVFGRIVLADILMKYYRTEEYYRGSAWHGTLGVDGGGALMNQGIHGVDLLVHLCGPVRSVAAHSRTMVHPIETEDVIAVLLEFESGALGVIEASTAAYPGSPRRLEISGEYGTAVLEENRIVSWKTVNGDEAIQPSGAGTSGANDPKAIGFRDHAKQIGNMVAAINGEEDLVIDGGQGRIPLSVILAAYKSAERDGGKISPI
ncbi:MAG: Gfo/Idh/MocA family oxidoreductase [Spirochaetaceae bacterium]|jgi:predicted dehydrogenase|nr:Gfo/Idh/MocA family oxidoreductase [Spirochaetaceae bacterium]